MEADIAPYREDVQVALWRTKPDRREIHAGGEPKPPPIWGSKTFGRLSLPNADGGRPDCYWHRGRVTTAKRLIQSMMNDNAFDLAEFEVKESSEQWMLARR